MPICFYFGRILILVFIFELTRHFSCLFFIKSNIHFFYLFHYLYRNGCILSIEFCWWQTIENESSHQDWWDTCSYQPYLWLRNVVSYFYAINDTGLGIWFITFIILFNLFLFIECILYKCLQCECHENAMKTHLSLSFFVLGH